jgi:multiple RNA-binding domain-containing protein 1
VEFVSVEEANNAFNSLQNTHLYGRKLVLEWAEEGGNKKLEI